MPAADARAFGFKYVKGHPGNQAEGLQTVTGFGVLADVATGYHYLIRSEEHTSELQSLMRISYAVFCLKKKKNIKPEHTHLYTKRYYDSKKRTKSTSGTQV